MVAVTIQLPTAAAVRVLPTMVQFALSLAKLTKPVPEPPVVLSVVLPPKATVVDTALAVKVACAPAAIVNAKAALPVLPDASVTLTVNAATILAVGVPERTPALDSVKPVGNAPAVTVYDKAPAPPATVMVWL